MNSEDLIKAVEGFLARQATPIYLQGGEAVFRISSDGGKTFREIGHGCIGEIKVVPPTEDTTRPLD